MSERLLLKLTGEGPSLAALWPPDFESGASASSANPAQFSGVSQALPFLLLLPRANKMDPRTLATASTIILLGRITDLYLMVIPPFSPARAWPPAFWDVVTLAAIISGWLFIALRNFFSSEPLPVGDPHLPQSLHEHA